MKLSPLIVAALLVASCKGDSRSKPRIRVSVDPEMGRCLDALADTSKQGGDYLATIARGCASACPGGFGDAATALTQRPLVEADLWSALRQCNLACSGDAMSGLDDQPMAARMERLVGACGVTFYALPNGHAPLFSDAAFLAGRVHEWIHRVEGALDQSQRERLDRVTTTAHIPLPPPPTIKGTYQLPASAAGTVFSSRFYLVVGKDTLRAAAPPVARLRGPTLELRPVPGGMPPGEEVPVGKEREKLAALEDSWRGLHPAVGNEHPRYTYLADVELSVDRLMQVANLLGHGGFRLGVAGIAAREHQVEVAVPPAVGSAAPVVSLAGGELSFPDADGESVTDSLRRALLERAPSASVELHVEPGTSIAELSRALDVIASARGAKAFVVVSSPAQ